MPLRTLAFAILAVTSAGAFAAPANTALTLYHSDDNSLFSAGDNNGAVPTGNATAREPRQLDLKAGTQDISLDGLPQYIDAETLSLGIDASAGKVISQRLRIGQGQYAALSGLIGQPVDVYGPSNDILASGTLLRAGSDGLLVKDTTSNERTALIHDYASVKAHGMFQTGSSLQLRVDATRAGKAQAILSYATSGLGWRAAYVATLAPGDSCRMAFESRASVANRSGRDWNDVQLTLVAGQPQVARSSGPRPMMYAAHAKAADDAMPEQSTLADYRTYALPDLVDLPDGSVSQMPLYATRTVACERTALYENSVGWVPPQPMIAQDFTIGAQGSGIVSTLQFKAFDSLPAGHLRVLTADHNGTPQFIGEGNISDTPKGADARITLGTAFDLRGNRERTRFTVDKDGRTLDEGFRITLTNAGDSARTVTVREHPQRWRQWTLTSSSSKPTTQSTDALEFKVTVPANGSATLDYSVRYQWSAEERPQG